MGLNTPDLLIRPETPADADAIRELTTAAFLTAEHASGTEAAIVDALRAAGALTLSLVAETEGEVIGHVAFSPVSITGRAGDWFGLGPVSVRPDRQRGGVGRALIEQGLAVLKAQGADGCVVLGDPAYYRRFGFANDPALIFADIPPPYFQRIVFRGASPGGQVAYHRAFEAG